MKQALAYFYWAEELDTCVRRAEDWQDEQGDDLLHQAVAWQCLSAQCRSEWFALWLAPHLHNQFAQPAERPSLYGYTLDKTARRFMALLQRVLVTGQWPGSIDVSALGGYGPLLLALQEPQSFERALVDYCDWRIANALGYPEMGASKRRRQSDGWSLLDREDWEQVFPIELLTLKHAYERATGNTISLDAPHPLLQGHLMKDPFPALEPLWEDDLTRQLQDFHAQMFGKQFGLRHAIEVRYL